MAGWLAEREERWKNFREINAISRPNAGSFATSVTRIRVQADGIADGHGRERGVLISINVNYSIIVYVSR